MQERAVAHVAQVVLLEAEPAGYAHRHVGHIVGVCCGVGVLRLERVREHAERCGEGGLELREQSTAMQGAAHVRGDGVDEEQVVLGERGRLERLEVDHAPDLTRHSDRHR